MSHPVTGIVLAVMILAAYRVTRLVTLDDIADPLRSTWWRWFPQHTKPGELIACPYCVGWWVSGAAVLVAAAVGFVAWRWATIALWPAVAGGQALLNAVDERLGG